MESLRKPRPEEFWDPEVDELLKDAKDLSTEKIVNMLKGKEPLNFFDPRDLKEVLLRRNITFIPDEPSNSSLWPYFSVLFILSILAFFGWKLFKSLKDKEKKREEKKKLKQKKKK